MELNASSMSDLRPQQRGFSLMHLCICCSPRQQREELNTTPLLPVETTHELQQSPSGSQHNQTEQPKWPVIFQWHHGGEEVSLLVLWGESSELETSEEIPPPPPPKWIEIKMEKLRSGQWATCVNLSEGVYHYTFVVDDVTSFDKDKPIDMINGCRRNKIRVNEKNMKKMYKNMNKNAN